MFSSQTSSNDPKVNWANIFFLEHIVPIYFRHKTVTTADKVTTLVAMLWDAKSMKTEDSYSDTDSFTIRIETY